MKGFEWGLFDSVNLVLWLILIFSNCIIIVLKKKVK